MIKTLIKKDIYIHFVSLTSLFIDIMFNNNVVIQITINIAIKRWNETSVN